MREFQTEDEARAAGRTDMEAEFAEHGDQHLLPERIQLERLIRKLSYGSFASLEQVKAYAESVQEVIDAEWAKRAAEIDAHLAEIKAKRGER